MKEVIMVRYATCLVALVLSACAGDPGDPGAVQLAVRDDGAGAGEARVTATEEDEGEVVLDETLRLDASATASLVASLPAGRYAIAIEATDRASAAVVARGEATIEVGARGEAFVLAALRSEGRVEIRAGQAPIIERIDVQGDGAGGVTIDVSARDPEGSTVTVTVAGARSLVTASASAGGSASLALGALEVAGRSEATVVVQDADGAATAARVELEAGGDTSAAGPAIEAQASARACWEAHARCIAGCDLGLTQAACRADCAVELATCGG
jgi:hypothetical protein